MDFKMSETKKFSNKCEFPPFKVFLAPAIDGNFLSTNVLEGVLFT